MNKLLLLLFFMFLGQVSLAKESSTISVPSLQAPVNDYAKMFSETTVSELNSKISNYKKTNGPQVAVLTVNSLNGYSIEEVANKIFNSWKLGDAKRDDGLLVLIALVEKKTRIEVGQGLEGMVTDVEATRIAKSVNSLMKNKQYDKAITSMTDSLLEKISKGLIEESNYRKVLGTTDNAPANSNKNSGSHEMIFLQVLVSGFLLFFSMEFMFTQMSNVEKLKAKYDRKKENIEADRKNKEHLLKTDADSISLLTQLITTISNDRYKTMNQMIKNNSKESSINALKSKNENLKKTINKYLGRG